MTALWSAAEIGTVLGIKPDGGDGRDVTGVSIDTRTLQPGDLFVALTDQRDGHDFVSAAFKAGAAAALVSENYVRQAGDGTLFQLADTLKSLESLGHAARQRLDADTRIVAVTGSAGKTGTKEMLRTCFAALGPTHASEKSYNNHWGVPLTLARMPRATRYGVFEIGMNHAGEIRPLTKMVRPHAAIVTTVEAVHLEHFPSVEGIADAKAEIFEGLLPGGMAIIKYDNPHRQRLIDAAKRCGAVPVTFGFHAAADVRGEDLRTTAEGSDMTVVVGGQRHRVTLAMPGRHLAENALAVAAAAAAIGADLDLALSTLASLSPPPGRGARRLLAVAGEEALLIDESYNANPASMRAALATLGSVPRDKFARRIAVLGDMLELGPEAQDLHIGLIDAVDDAGVDLIFACGPMMKGLYDALPEPKKGGYAATSATLAATVVSAIKGGDVIMVKASNGSRLGAVISAVASTFGSGG